MGHLICHSSFVHLKQSLIVKCKFKIIGYFMAEFWQSFVMISLYFIIYFVNLYDDLFWVQKSMSFVMRVQFCGAPPEGSCCDAIDVVCGPSVERFHIASPHVVCLEEIKVAEHCVWSLFLFLKQETYPNNVLTHSDHVKNFKGFFWGKLSSLFSQLPYWPQCVDSLPEC